MALLFKPSELTHENSLPKFWKHLKTLFIYLWSNLKNFLLGLSYDEAAEMNRRLNQSSDDYQREQAYHRQNFIDNHKKGFGSLLFDESTDCPICLV